MKTVVVGTAGHIDHGKSSLVKALTGTDPDRWEEERRRGITIDLGFAHRALREDSAAEVLLDFVDVPGHERFVKNMLAGVGGIDLVLFVIAADESIKPQTREHFDICRLLGVRSGVVALTKSDLVTPDLLELVRLEADDLFAGSFLEGAPVVPVSAITGQGLDQLLQALRRAAQDSPARDSARPFRLPIDRAFVIKGFGAVVTGTLISGTLEKETEAEIYPSSRAARIRGIQVHGQSASRAAAGQRTAVNLAGVETSDLARGMVLAPPGRFRPTTRFDARLHLLQSARPLKNRAPVHFHSGTAEGIAQVICLGGARTVAPGATSAVQIHLREPLLLLPGDRFILRQFSPVITVGGGVVLDNLAPRHKASEDCTPFLGILDTGSRPEILAALLERGHLGLEHADILARTGWSDAELRETAREAEAVSEKPLILVSRARFAAALTAMLGEVARFHKANPLVAGITREELREHTLPVAHPAVFDAALARLIKEGKLETAGEIVRQIGRQVVLDDAETGARRSIAEAFERAGLAVPSMKEVLDSIAMDGARKQKLLQLLLKDRELVRVTPDLVFHRAALDRLKGMLAQHKAHGNAKINVGQFKDLAGITRKYAIPLLEYMDRERVTRRAGDERIIL
jgi:selenocysteine-specific elongation factor